MERPQRHRVTAGGRFGKGSGVGAGWRSPAVGHRPPRHPRAGRDRLDAAVATAGAWLPVEFDDDVADVTGIAGPPLIRHPIEHQPTAHAGGNDHAEQEADTAGGTTPVLAERHAHAVAGQPHRHVRYCGGDPVAQRKAAPAGDVYRGNAPGGQVDGARAGDAYRADRPLGDLDRVGDHLVDHTPNLFRPLILRCGPGGGMNQVAGRVDESDGDLGAADVEGQGEHLRQCRWVLSG